MKSEIMEYIDLLLEKKELTLGFDGDVKKYSDISYRDYNGKIMVDILYTDLASVYNDETMFSIKQFTKSMILGSDFKKYLRTKQINEILNDK